ncbi:PP2C family protein-serine/threonine phosphatase [Brevirhabdus pacifica]|uniref:PP2C family protein-serine/threonine phosphatase n=1 Tax=Brevirhabdus pacifica TaxID=1267768 RepID=UPI003A1036D2
MRPGGPPAARACIGPLAVAAGTAARRRLTILLVEDSPTQRRILCRTLERFGFRVLEAASGARAMEICRTTQIDMVICDWIMPGMSGPEFCRSFRKLDREGYGYFILMTSISDKAAVAAALDIGADDFVTKPVDVSELRARIRAGERILAMEGQLRSRNRVVNQTLDELRVMYDGVERDLRAAQRLQESLLPELHQRHGGARISLLLRASGHVGGDLVGTYPIDARRIGIYALDVSGHGVSSALVTARLSGYLSGHSPVRHLALRRDGEGQLVHRPPEETVARLNRLMLAEVASDHYLTLLLAEVDTSTGAVALCQAGHPNPVIQRRDGRIEFPGGGGFPVGLLPDALYTRLPLTLSPGDRLLLTSDGIGECEDPEGRQLGQEGLKDILTRCGAATGQGFLDALMAELEGFAGEAGFGDDISVVNLEFTTPPDEGAPDPEAAQGTAAA